MLQSTAALKECQRDKDVAMADAVKTISQLKLELEHMASVGLSPCSIQFICCWCEAFVPDGGVHLGVGEGVGGGGGSTAVVGIAGHADTRV